MIDFLKAIESGQAPSVNELVLAAAAHRRQARALRVLSVIPVLLLALAWLVMLSVGPVATLVPLWTMTGLGAILVAASTGMSLNQAGQADALESPMAAECGPEMLVAVGTVPTGDAYCDGILEQGRNFLHAEFVAMTALAAKARIEAANAKLHRKANCACC